MTTKHSMQLSALAGASNWPPQAIPALMIVWDIDGTLVAFKRNSQDKHLAAVKSVVGEIEGSIASESGMTDREIAQRYLEANGIPVADYLLESILAKLDELSEVELTTSPAMPLPGSLKALREMRMRGWSNAVLTGNTPHRAALKLDSAGLGGEFSGALGFFGAAHSSRSLVAAEAKSFNSVFPWMRMAAVGDTPRDVDAALSAGLPVAAVATGKYALDELELLGADLVIPDLDSGLQDLVGWLRRLVGDNLEA